MRRRWFGREKAATSTADVGEGGPHVLGEDAGFHGVRGVQPLQDVEHDIIRQIAQPVLSRD